LAEDGIIEEWISIRASIDYDDTIISHPRLFEWEQVPKCWNDERRIAIIALEMTVGIVDIIASFARSIPMSFLKIVVENRLEPLRSERTTSKRARPSALEITHDGWCTYGTFDREVQRRATRLDTGR
jgi:hypothetical protein